MTNDLVRTLRDQSRYRQDSCPKCEKGFENGEYHCWGPETPGCLASQPELQQTVNQWKKERVLAASRIEVLENQLRGAFAIVSVHKLEVAKARNVGFNEGIEKFRTIVKSFPACQTRGLCSLAGYGDLMATAYAAAISHLKRTLP